jgi:hypothetical protein
MVNDSGLGASFIFCLIHYLLSSLYTCLAPVQFSVSKKPFGIAESNRFGGNQPILLPTNHLL